MWLESIDLREACLARHWLVLLLRSFMCWIKLLAPSLRADANAFDEGKALGEEATLGIFLMKSVIPMCWVLNSVITSLVSQPPRGFIAPCVHVGASAAATMEVELERAAADTVHVMAKSRVQEASRWTELSIHSQRSVTDKRSVAMFCCT